MIDPVNKVLNPSAADFASVYSLRAGGVVQNITHGLTLREYRASTTIGKSWWSMKVSALCDIHIV